MKTNQLMLYRVITAVCSQIHTKHINILCGQNVESVNVKLVVHLVTTGVNVISVPVYGSVHSYTSSMIMFGA